MGKNLHPISTPDFGNKSHCAAQRKVRFKLISEVWQIANAKNVGL